MTSIFLHLFGCGMNSVDCPWIFDEWFFAREMALRSRIRQRPVHLCRTAPSPEKNVRCIGDCGIHEAKELLRTGFEPVTYGCLSYVNPTTVHRSTNWAIEGCLEMSVKHVCIICLLMHFQQIRTTFWTNAEWQQKVQHRGWNDGPNMPCRIARPIQPINPLGTLSVGWWSSSDCKRVMMEDGGGQRVSSVNGM